MIIAIFGLIGVLLGSIIAASIQLLISAQQRKTAFRLAALAKRLEAHQEAFHLWRRLLFSLNNPEELSKIIQKAEPWWETHCLYLDEKYSNSFHASLIGAGMLQSVTKDVETRKDIFNKIYETGKNLTKGIGLPHLEAVEDKSKLFKSVFGKKDSK
jgi:hypothetical protein